MVQRNYAFQFINLVVRNTTINFYHFSSIGLKMCDVVNVHQCTLMCQYHVTVLIFYSILALMLIYFLRCYFFFLQDYSEYGTDVKPSATYFEAPRGNFLLVFQSKIMIKPNIFLPPYIRFSYFPYKGQVASAQTRFRIILNLKKINKNTHPKS